MTKSFPNKLLIAFSFYFLVHGIAIAQIGECWSTPGQKECHQLGGQCCGNTCYYDGSLCCDGQHFCEDQLGSCCNGKCCTQHQICVNGKCVNKSAGKKE